MAIINIELGYEINSMIQVGDTVYSCTPSANGEFSYQSLDNTTRIGICSSVSTTSINVDTQALAIALPQEDDFIFFSKESINNTSSLKGYYAEVEFTNTSTSYSELFSVGAQVVQSSK